MLASPPASGQLCDHYIAESERRQATVDFVNLEMSKLPPPGNACKVQPPGNSAGAALATRRQETFDRESSQPYGRALPPEQKPVGGAILDEHEMRTQPLRRISFQDWKSLPRAATVHLILHGGGLPCGTRWITGQISLRPSLEMPSADRHFADQLVARADGLLRNHSQE
jgi:hypothetical protein